MNLRLQFPPEPAHAKDLAALVVAPALRVDKIILDYSPTSLAGVDEIFRLFRQRGTKREDVSETIFSFGCYVGEVFVRHLGGTWRMPADTQLPRNLLEHFPFMVIEMQSAKIWNPIAK